VTKPFAALVALTLVIMVLGLATVLLWGVAEQIARKCRHDHARALRLNAARLEQAGYLEAAEQFRNYAELMETPASKRPRLKT
jgi:uncharacterized protein HemX